MVKLARGGMNNSNRGRSKPRPLFPPGELPLFGPPPAYMRRPGPPIPPPARGPVGYDYGPPPPPPMRLPPHLGPPMPPPPHMPLRGRPGRPPPPMPLLQAPVMPPRPLPFLRGRGMGPRMGLGKGIKKANRRKLRRNKKVAPATSQNKPEETAKTNEEVKKEEEDILNGPWINDSIKVEIEKMNDLKKKSDETKNSSDVNLYNEQQKKVNSMASAAKMEYIGSQPDSNGEYYCEVCDRSWMTPEELEVHLSEHVTCHVENCSFNAAPKIVALHVKLQHDSGMFDKIVKSSNREDIEKWREERRRNFPTMENIQKKLAERKEMEERGERVEQTNKSFNKNRPMHCSGRGKAEERSFNHKRKRNKFKNSKIKSGNEVKGFNPQFLSTASLPNDIGDAKNDEDYNISDEEWISDSKGVVESAPISNILMNLSSTYASDDEGDSQEIVSDQKVSHQVKTLDKNGESDDEPPEEEKIARLSDSVSNDGMSLEPTSKVVDRFSKRNKIHAKLQSQPKPKVMKWQPSLRKRPLTLLEKLLTKEIKQERNFILQCIRFIINENYFETS